ncbi:N-acetylneuraminate synthase [Thermodesulfobacteriota bacterium]
MVEILRYGDRRIGPGQKCFIIAEAGVNHNGRLDLAIKLVDIACHAGADAVKFQTFRAERLAAPNAPKAEYQKKTTGAEESQFDMLKRLELPDAGYLELFAYCRQQGILFMSTPFDEESADMLAEIGMEIFKIPSGELTNLSFLDHVARIGRPIILSTGMATLSEVERAVDTVIEAGNRHLALLHCVSNYPADPANANLRAMNTMARAFGTPVGFSDHTSGIEVALAAIALGASIIEKHFTVDRNLPGPDHQASLEPLELTALVTGIRKIEAAMGNGEKVPAVSELGTAEVARRSLVAATDLAAGSIIQKNHIAIRRPGTGLPPVMLESLVGRRLRRPVSAGMLLTLEMFE